MRRQLHGCPLLQPHQSKSLDLLVEADPFRRSEGPLAAPSWLGDRPDISNPKAAPGSRTVLWTTTGPQACQTGYRNPDTKTCTSPADVHWIEGVGFPNASTVGRNTQF